MASTEGCRLPLKEARISIFCRGAADTAGERRRGGAEMGEGVAPVSRHALRSVVADSGSEPSLQRSLNAPSRSSNSTNSAVVRQLFGEGRGGEKTAWHLGIREAQGRCGTRRFGRGRGSMQRLLPRDSGWTLQRLKRLVLEKQSAQNEPRRAPRAGRGRPTAASLPVSGRGAPQSSRQPSGLRTVAPGGKVPGPRLQKKRPSQLTARGGVSLGGTQVRAQLQGYRVGDRASVRGAWMMVYQGGDWASVAFKIRRVLCQTHSDLVRVQEPDALQWRQNFRPPPRRKGLWSLKDQGPHKEGTAA
ncbi:hypothetical protein Efla_004557 [Eimeria flavescens]